MKYILLLLSLLLSLYSFGEKEKYTVSGTITDRKTGETILGATVFLEGTNNGVVSNEYGFFSLTEVQGDYTLIISYLGYKTYKKILSLNTNKKLKIDLEENVSQLEEVVVTAEKDAKEKLKSPEMGIAEMKVETIKAIPVVLGETDVLKSLQTLPGVTNNGEGSAGLHIRGGASDQNLVLLDEAVVYNTSHLFGFFSVFNADAIKGLKLYKGAIPAKFGGRTSAVLDIRQKDGNQNNFDLFGGIGLLSSRLTMEAPIFKNKGSFLISGRGSYAHLFMKLFGLNNSAYFYDLNLKGSYKINDNNRIFISGYFGSDVIDFKDIIDNSYGNTTANLRWNHIFNSKLFSNLSLIQSRYDYMLKLLPVELHWKSNISNYNLKYDLSYYLNSEIKLDFGVSAIDYTFNPGEVMPTSKSSPIVYKQLDIKKAQEFASYFSVEHRMSPRLTAEYGMRFSYFRRMGGQSLNTYLNDQPLVYNAELDIYEKGKIIGEKSYEKGKSIINFSNWEPRLALSFQTGENASVKLSYSRLAQYIHILSNTSSVTPLDVWTPSGPFIKPQLGTQYSIGYFTGVKEDLFALETELYYKTGKNRIDYVDASELLAQNTIETEILSGESRAYGLELLLKKEKGRATGWIAYTLSKSEQRTLGGNAGGLGINGGKWYNTSYDRTHNLNITATYKLNKKWSFSTNFTFQTGRPTTYPNAKYEYQGNTIASYGLRNANRLPAYHRLDISATLTPQKNTHRKWKGEWVFGIYNIYDRKNAAAISFGQNAETGVTEATRTAIFGFVPSVTYNFKF